MTTKDYLILLKVAVMPDGSLRKKLINYLDTNNQLSPNEVMKVSPGDRLAWIVQVFVGNTPRLVPYEIRFMDASRTKPNETFLGVSSISVPTGGTSPFLNVRSLQESIYYSISVPGMGVVLDPEIQTGDSTSLNHGRIKPDAGGTAYSICWDVTRNTFSVFTIVDAEEENASESELLTGVSSLSVNRGDTVQFTALRGVVSVSINISFPVDFNNTWVTPFSPDSPVLPGPGLFGTTVGPYKVVDDRDPTGSIFTFTAQTEDLANTSIPFSLTLVKA
jgi:hypothetical protein